MDNELRTLEEHFLSKYGFEPIVTNVKHAYAEPPYIERKVQWKIKMTDNVYLWLMTILTRYGFKVEHCKDINELKYRILLTLIEIYGNFEFTDLKNDIFGYLHNG